MTAHGAYTKLMTAMRHTRGYAHDSSKNVKAMWAAGPIREDTKLIEEMNELAEQFRSLEQSLKAMKERSYKLARDYLNLHNNSVTKTYELVSGSPSMRVRPISKNAH